MSVTPHGGHRIRSLLWRRPCIVSHYAGWEWNPRHVHLTPKAETRRGCCCSRPLAAPPNDCNQRTSLRGHDAFAEWLADARSGWAPANCSETAPPDRARLCAYLAGFYIQGRLRCDEQCCRLRNDYPGHEMLYLESICFAPTEAGPHRITSIRLIAL